MKDDQKLKNCSRMESEKNVLEKKLDVINQHKCQCPLLLHYATINSLSKKVEK